MMLDVMPDDFCIDVITFPWPRSANWMYFGSVKVPTISSKSAGYVDWKLKWPSTPCCVTYVSWIEYCTEPVKPLEGSKGSTNSCALLTLK